ncbi:hypothetical protein SCA6_004986 [Theobroma cacao]
MATAGGGGGNVKGTSSREGTAKSIVTEQISQAVQSTSNLLHLMQQSSPSQTQLMKLPKNLLAKAPTIKNTGQMLEQMPRVISALDAHIDSGLQRNLSKQINIPRLVHRPNILAMLRGLSH